MSEFIASSGGAGSSAAADELAKAAALTAAFLDARRTSAVTTALPTQIMRDRLERYDFVTAHDTTEVVADIYDLLGTFAVRNDHPRYFGLFNPPALPAAIIGDLMTAAVNPQLAVYSHAPAAAEIERKVLEFMGTCIGWRAADVAGMFTAGGSEANHTALLVALAKRYPRWSSEGLAAAPDNPSIYVSENAHLAWIKIARSVGLGSEAVRLVPTADGLALSGEALREFMAREVDRDPLMIVATAGTTAHGAVDDIVGIRRVAEKTATHFHVDAAWAGGALVAPGYRGIFEGIASADSITIDAHKWLCVPMGAGIFISRDWRPLQTAFAVSTSYMPSASLEHRDAYIHSLQWSRRCIGLKLFMALATLGERGYAALIEHQIAIADTLKDALLADGWKILNASKLPLVCFVPVVSGIDQDTCVTRIEADVVGSGQAWISSVRLKGKLVLRACVTSYQTTVADIAILLGVLADSRARLKDVDHRTDPR